MRRQALYWAIIAFCLAGLWLAGCGGSESEEQTGIQDVQEEAGEGAKAAKEYAGAQKDRFMDEAKAALEKTDRRIAEFKAKIESKWDEMDREARQKAEKAMDTMKAKRETLSKKIDEFKDSSAEAWDKMKKDFWETYRSLKDSIERTEESVTYI